MVLRFKGSFKRDLDIEDRSVLSEVARYIQLVKQARTLSQIPELKKLRNYKTLYRIKIAENYRIGIVVRGQVVWFVRFGHRQNFYKHFP